MKTRIIKNIALTVSLVSFAIGFSDLGENIVFWAGRPVGAIAFVIFFIIHVLEKEMALYDKQSRRPVQAQVREKSHGTSGTLHPNFQSLGAKH